MSDHKELIEQYRRMQAALGHGCHDGYCVIEKTKGMHTNGGCLCLEDMNFQDRQYVGHILRLTQEMADALEAATAEQVAIVKPLEWLGGGDRYHANGVQCHVLWSDDACRWIADCWFTASIGGWDDADQAMDAVNREYQRHIESIITLRSADHIAALEAQLAKSYAEGWNAAIDGAAAVATSDGCDFTASLIVALKRPVKGENQDGMV